ncbi:MAG: hypothetical protein KDA75_17495, partial [Planctomycetaceae bacterium]|nr:hypothetical protein [Planctomycetaceae bacterium]
GGHWVIAVYTEEEDKQQVAFYTSRDLKQWELASRIDGFFECPELFELAVDGDTENRRWVLFAADAQYLVGTFDGRTFVPDSLEKQRVHYGEFYASQCFSGVPEGRVIQIGWARINMPDMPFNQAFSLPVELTLRTTPHGLRLLAAPISELESLREEHRSVVRRDITPEKSLTVPVHGQLFDVLITLDPGDARTVALQFGRNRIVYDVTDGTLDEMPLPLQDGRVQFRVVIDRPMYEISGGGGTVYKTAARADGGDNIESFELSTTGGTATLESLDVFDMRSIWSSETAPR